MRAHLFSDSTRTSFETKVKKGTAKVLQGQLAHPKKGERESREVTKPRTQDYKEREASEVKTWAILLYFYVVFATAEPSSLSCKAKVDAVTCSTGEES